MISRFYSFKLIIGGAVLALILLVYGLILYSSGVYRDLAINNRIQSLQALIAIESQEIIEQSSERQRQFGWQLRNHSQLRSALKKNDAVRLEAWLLQYFAEQTDAYPDFLLRALVIRAADGGVIAQASDTDFLGFGGCFISLPLIDKTETPQVNYTLCRYNQGLYSDVAVEVDPLNPGTKIQVVIDIVEVLKTLEQHTDQPIRLSSADGEEIFLSSEWPKGEAPKYLLPVYRLPASDNGPGLDISAAFDQQMFFNELEASRTNTLLLTSVWVLCILFLVAMGLVIAFRPLNRLHNSVGEMLTGKFAAIEVDKLPSELHELLDAYNQMVVSLEEETISRRQVEERLRSEKDFISTTLNSIQNPVIVIDSKEKIKLLNPAAEDFLAEKEKKLIDKPIHELLILYSNRRITRIVDITQLLNHKTSWSSMFYHHPDRRVVELEFSASPMIDMETEDIGYVIILKDVSEDRQLRRKLNYEGRHDQLTGFLNRIAFEQKFENIVAESSGGHQQHVLAYLDIDQFKIVNETCGNIAGDQLLKQVGELIQANVRKSDILARLSGDEYGIIMPFFELKRALDAMQKIIIDIQHSRFIWDEKEYHVTASIGIIMFGKMRDEYVDFYPKVTTACYLAKENGGNQYHFVDEDDRQLIAQQESMEWVSGIMKGFTEDRFCLYVQPIVSMNANEDFSHYEVLIRYRSPDGQIIPPGDFLPPAERYNLIEKVDSWVVRKMIDWLRQNGDQISNKMFSVNLSGRSIGSETFHRFLKDSLTDSGIELGNLCFEITETAAVENIEKSVEFITSIRQLGAKISLDDFGTGLSSFSYLKQFPVDYLKIDGEFVRDIIDDDKSFVFVRSMTELGHCLDMKVIAEFVESDTMFDRLREANVDYIQGYTVGKPVSIDTLINIEAA